MRQFIFSETHFFIFGLLEMADKKKEFGFPLPKQSDTSADSFTVGACTAHVCSFSPCDSLGRIVNTDFVVQNNFNPRLGPSLGDHSCASAPSHEPSMAMPPHHTPRGRHSGAFVGVTLYFHLRSSMGRSTIPCFFLTQKTRGGGWVGWVFGWVDESGPGHPPRVHGWEMHFSRNCPKRRILVFGGVSFDWWFFATSPSLPLQAGLVSGAPPPRTRTPFFGPKDVVLAEACQSIRGRQQEGPRATPSCTWQTTLRSTSTASPSLGPPVPRPLGWYGATLGIQVTVLDGGKPPEVYSPSLPATNRW